MPADRVFMASCEGRKTFPVLAPTAERAAEMYMESHMGELRGMDAWTVDVRPLLGERTTYCVANGGCIHASTDGFVFMPSVASGTSLFIESAP